MTSKAVEPTNADQVMLGQFAGSTARATAKQHQQQHQQQQQQQQNVVQIQQTPVTSIRPQSKFYILV